MDIDAVRAGVILICPVKVKGAGVHMGDMHAGRLGSLRPITWAALGLGTVWLSAAAIRSVWHQRDQSYSAALAW
jgi:hypothetical protein